MPSVVVNITTTTPQEIAPAVAGVRNIPLGFSITSASTCTVTIKVGATTIHTIRMPGGDSRIPNRAWEMGRVNSSGPVANEAITVESDTGSVVVCGSLIYTTEKVG
jgi:hypothetical protein